MVDKNTHNIIENIHAIVIGYDHYNTLNVIRALGESCISFDLILISNVRSQFTTKSKYVRTFYVLSKIDNLVEYLMSAYSSKAFKSAVIPTADDIALTLNDNDSKLNNFLHMPTAGFTEGAIGRIMDKYLMSELAKDSGFNVPQSVSINPKDIDNAVLSKISYPCIMKAQLSAKGSKDDMRICNSETELRECLSILASSLERVLIQQYIPSTDIIEVAGCSSTEGDVYVNGTVIKTRAGRFLNNLGVGIMGFVDDETVEERQIRRFIELTKYNGLFAFEFLRYNNKLYFIEVNLRSDALLYFYTASGINLVEYWVKRCFGIPFPIKKRVNKSICMNEFQYIRNYLSLKNLSCNLKELISVDVFAVFSKSDIKPFLYKLINRSNA